MEDENQDTKLLVALALVAGAGIAVQVQAQAPAQRPQPMGAVDTAPVPDALCPARRAGRGVALRAHGLGCEGAHRAGLLASQRQCLQRGARA